MMTSGIVVAAGSGARAGEGQNKLLRMIGGRPAIWWTLRAVADAEQIHELILVTRHDMVAALRELVEVSPFNDRVTHIVPGGRERQDSVFEGLRRIDKRSDYVLIHDGARPIVTTEMIENTLAAALQYGAAASASPLSDTIKAATVDGVALETLDRSRLWAIQTPQIFRRDLIVKAHETGRSHGYEATDDAALVERLGHPVRLVASKEHNTKITTTEDFPIAEALLRSRGHLPIPLPRVGLGYDVHRFCASVGPDRSTRPRKLVLGGVEIPGALGLDGHSDADVVLHAVCDALLGAAGKRDIGYYFPNDDPGFKDISSLSLLEKVVSMLRQDGYRVHNIDVAVIAEQPRLADYVPPMVRSISCAAEVAVDRVSIKATTNEGLGALGRAEGIAAHAVATIIPSYER